ncbi:MAG TPA: hypothetical protein PLL33_13360, partial [Paracoccus sp. (in: a-proteobacteria)]|nr:hypothetical protein [Paracoccus sp. (in: a-proteobacteria)]
TASWLKRLGGVLPVAAVRPQPRPEVVPQSRPDEPKTARPAREKPRKAAKAETRPKNTGAEREQAPSAQRRRESTPWASAASGSATGGGARAQATWRSTASAAVARHMQRGRYTAAGPVTATIRLTVNGSGRITAASAASGGGGALDAALNRQIRRLGRLPAPPGGQPLSVVVPVRISR